LNSPHRRNREIPEKTKRGKSGDNSIKPPHKKGKTERGNAEEGGGFFCALFLNQRSEQMRAQGTKKRGQRKKF